jgi:hypothetical protein
MHASVMTTTTPVSLEHLFQESSPLDFEPPPLTCKEWEPVAETDFSARRAPVAVSGAELVKFGIFDDDVDEFEDAAPAKPQIDIFANRKDPALSNPTPVAVGVKAAVPVAVVAEGVVQNLQESTVDEMPIDLVRRVVCG